MLTTHPLPHQQAAQGLPFGRTIALQMLNRRKRLCPGTWKQFLLLFSLDLLFLFINPFGATGISKSPDPTIDSYCETFPMLYILPLT